MEIRIVFAGALLLASSGAFCADAIHWGPPVEGLQLGVAIGSKPEPTLRVMLKNIGRTPQELPFGFEDDPENPPNLIITTRGLRRSEVRVFDTIGAKYEPGPDRGPARTLKLPPGGTHEFTYLLSQLVCLINRTDISLTDLLKQGYSVRVSFGFRQTAVVSADVSLAK
ncbi:MAG: hypothetical protein ACLP59_10205 [Bryobacteraceae bacterium]